MNCEECENFKPKRKQTGWVCRSCRRTTPCVRAVGTFSFCSERTDIDWQPFYGKVVE